MAKKAPKISALIFDLDGTAFPTGVEVRISTKVISAVKKAKDQVAVSIATGRTLGHCRDVLRTFELLKPVIICGGTQLIDPKTFKIVWEEPLKPQIVHQIFHLLAPFSKYKIFSNSENIDLAIEVHSYNPPKHVSIFYLLAITEADVNRIVQALQGVEGISLHILHSWTPGLWDIHITDELATKKHSMQVLLAREGLNHKNVMVVGDGNNDLPLFELAGWKVAMGNAGEKLKAAADWIAPSVEDDGLAVAIEKFILKYYV